MIDNEIKNAKDGKKAYIYVKCNSLTDERMIGLLYKASKAGVRVRLIVRGACCLMPEVKGLSDNIRAISIVDKYLEHARLVLQWGKRKGVYSQRRLDDPQSEPQSGSRYPDSR